MTVDIKYGQSQSLLFLEFASSEGKLLYVIEADLLL